MTTVEAWVIIIMDDGGGIGGDTGAGAGVMVMVAVMLVAVFTVRLSVAAE